MEPKTNLVPTWWSRSPDAEIRLAARFDGPVLISASPDEALAIARRIASGHRGKGPAEVLVCDPMAGDDVPAAIAAARSRRSGTRTILLFREVHALTAADQAAVMEALTLARLEPERYPGRIIASSSIDLHERVERGYYDSRLYYRLNQIHILAAPCGIDKI